MDFNKYIELRFSVLHLNGPKEKPHIFAVSQEIKRLKYLECMENKLD